MTAESAVATDVGRRASIRALLTSLLVCYAASAAGGLATAQGVNGWYTTIAKPSFNPPNWIFGPVWSVLFTAMAIAVWRVWQAGPPRKRALQVFGLQLALNVVWSALFFALESPGAALAGIIALLAAILWTIALFWPRSRLAAALLIPYAAWVSFATLLNAAIWSLNR